MFNGRIFINWFQTWISISAQYRIGPDGHFWPIPSNVILTRVSNRMVIDKGPGLSKVASWYRLLLFRRWGRGSSDYWPAVSLVLSKCFERIFNLPTIQCWGNFWFSIFLERAARSQPCTLEMLWTNSKTWWTLQTKMRDRLWNALVRGHQSLVTYQRDLFLKLCHQKADEQRGAKEFPRRN